MPAPTPVLNLPPDAAELLAFAEASRPELRNFTHATGHVRAQNDLNQWVHIQHKDLRKRLKAKLSADAASA